MRRGQTHTANPYLDKVIVIKEDFFIIFIFFKKCMFFSEI